MVKKKEEKDPIIEAIAADYKKKNIKTGVEAQNYLAKLLQPLMQVMLDTELDNHLNYSRYEHSENKENSRNGHCKSKKVKTTYGDIEVSTPRDRAGTFEPIAIEKGQTSFPSFEDKCIAMYAKGMSLRDIELTLKDIYGVRINKDDISRLISAVNQETENWRNRPLKPLYVFCYADCLYVPIRDDGLRSEKKAVYVVIGVDAHGYKDILGLWIDKTESGSFWCNVFEDIKSRGVKDILYVTSDGIAGFKGSLETVFPKTQAQRCVVHLARNIYNLSPKKQAKEILADFKTIYSSTDYESAKANLDDFCNKYKDNKNIVKKVKEFMPYLEPLFELPTEIRKCIYTSNSIESVNSALRKVTRGKGSFPNEASVYKVMYLRIRELSEKWQKPIKNWEKIEMQLSDLFGERYTQYLSL